MLYRVNIHGYGQDPIEGPLPATLKELHSQLQFRQPFYGKIVFSENTVLSVRGVPVYDDATLNYCKDLNPTAKYLDLSIMFLCQMYVGRLTPTQYVPLTQLITARDEVEEDKCEEAQSVGKKRKRTTIEKFVVVPMFADRGFDETFKNSAKLIFQTHWRGREDINSFELKHYSKNKNRDFPSDLLSYAEHNVAFIQPPG